MSTPIVDELYEEIQRLQAELSKAKEWGQCFHTAGLELAEENKQLTERVAVLEEALKPFSHHDLSEILGGNAEGDRSIVFARNKAVLKIGDFKSAQKALEDK